MKGIIVYYSLEGNTRFIAETLQEETGFDLLELKPVKEIPTKGLMKFIWGGKQVAFKESPKLEPYRFDPTPYDLVVIGTPVWNSSFVPPIRSFIKQNSITGKKIALFCCYSGSPAKTFTGLKDMLNGNAVIGETGFKDPLVNEEMAAAKSAREWIRNMMS